jgi:hypothetical protein
MNTTMRKITTIRAMIPMLLKCLYLLTRELEQQYGHCHQDDQEAATRLAQDAASTFCPFCCLTSAFLVFRSILLRPFFMPLCIGVRGR